LHVSGPDEDMNARPSFFHLSPFTVPL
jgi:hypothetical protein